MSARRRQDWLQTGQLRIASAVAGDQSVEQLGDGVLKSLAEYLGAHAAAFFVKDGGSYRRVATYGAPAQPATPTHARTISAHLRERGEREH